MSLDKFYEKLRVKRLLDAYLDTMNEYALCLKEQFELTDDQLLEVLKMGVSSKLSQLSKTWKKVQPIAPSFVSVAEGDYVADIKEMLLTESKKTKRLQVETTLEIMDGEYEGKTVKRFDGIEDETSMGYFKNLCEVIGCEVPEDLELLQEAMNEFVANNTTDLFDITVKQNDKYMNVYVNGVSEYTKGEGEAQEEEVAEEETQEEVAEEEVAEEEVQEEEQVEEEEQAEEVEPPKKTLAKPIVKANAKSVAKPIAKPVAKVAAKPASAPIKKLGTIKKK